MRHFQNDFQLDWRRLGAVLERYPKFPNRTNVSFVRVEDDHTIEVRFWERGAGETMSSGTGSTGAAAAAFARGLVKSPVEVRTPAGPLRPNTFFSAMPLTYRARSKPASKTTP